MSRRALWIMTLGLVVAACGESPLVAKSCDTAEGYGANLRLDGSTTAAEAPVVSDDNLNTLIEVRLTQDAGPTFVGNLTFKNKFSDQRAYLVGLETLGNGRSLPDMAVEVTASAGGSAQLATGVACQTQGLLTKFYDVQLPALGTLSFKFGPVGESSAARLVMESR